MQKMEAGKIKSILDRTEYQDKKMISREEKISWEERIDKALSNKNTLEYTKAVESAKKLLAIYSARELEEMGEMEIKKLADPDVEDAAVIVGVAYQIEKIEKK